MGNLINEAKKLPNVNKHEYVKLTMHACLLVIAMGALIGYLQYGFYIRDRKVRDSVIDHYRELMQARADAFLEKLSMDANLMEFSPTLRTFLQHPSDQNLTTTQDALLQLASLRPYIDQVRLIDQQGIEQIHIDQRHGTPSLVKDVKDIASSDYVQTGFELADKEVYFSEIGLSPKLGSSPTTYRPIIYVITKVIANKKKSGLIVFTVHIKELLEGLQMVLGQDEQLVFLNSDGGWITGSNKHDWKFILEPSAKDAHLAEQAPSLWKKIWSHTAGKFEYQGQCYYYHWYKPNIELGPSPLWLLALRPKNRHCKDLASAAVIDWAFQLTAASTLALPLMWLGWRARQLRLELTESNTQLDLITKEADISLLMVDSLCRICWANPEAERLLGWKAEELIGVNLHERFHKAAIGDSLDSESCPTLLSLKTGERYRNDNDRIINRFGVVQHVSLRASPFGTGANRKSILAISDVKDFVERERSLTQLATMDELTGVLNRRSILRALKALLEAPSIPPCVLMADIDLFKQINDTYGHAAGDAILKTFASTLKNHLRHEDHLGRYGGEEFVIALCNLDLNKALEMAERLRLAVAESECLWKGNKTIKVTCSFGLAVYDGQETVTQLLARSDEALYRAKHLGRNRVEVA